MRNKTLLIVVVAIVLAAASLPLFAGPYFLSVFNTIFVYMSLALTWDMMLRTGQLSYGTAGLFGLGAYASALLVGRAGVNPLLSIAMGGLFAGALAFFLGFAVLRLRKIYFSITTLALTTVFSVIIRNLPKLTGGASGTVLPNALFNGDPAKNYWVIFVLTLGVIGISAWLASSKTHYAINAIRNDEITARSSGIDVFRYLLFIFVITSTLQGVIGAFYAQQYAFVQPEATFSMNFLLLPLAMALVGGVYSTIGPIVGAVLLGLVSEYLKLIMPYGHLIVYGVIIVLVVLFMPEGITGPLSKWLKRQAKVGGVGSASSGD
jgi:branched-chain amino acid transport system permease protein